MKQLIKRAARPTRSDTQSGRLPYETKKAPPLFIAAVATDSQLLFENN